MTQPIFDDAYYRWKDDPVEGEYELQFDRFETSARGERYDKAVLLITEKETVGTVGDVTLRTAAVPALDPEEPDMTRIFHSTIEDGEIVELTYKPELSERAHKDAQKRLDRMHGETDKSDTDD